MPPSTKDSRSGSTKSGKGDGGVTHRRQKNSATDASAASEKRSSVTRTNSQARTPATTRDNRAGLPTDKNLNETAARAARTAPAASRAPPTAPSTAQEAPATKTRVAPLSQSKHAAGGVSPQPHSVTPQTGMATAPQGSTMGAGATSAPYGSMGVSGMQNYVFMGPSGYGSMGPGGFASGGDNSAMGMPRQGSFQGNPYGSMAADGMGSQMGGMGSMGGDGMMNPYGSMGPDGMMNPYGSMGADGMGGGSMYGMMPGSMYGQDPNGAYGGGQIGSMYGMNPMMGGSMYGMGGPMMGSMYGMGGPMMGGSMYGMNPMMGSMYGPMGSMYGQMMGSSMYGMGSMYMGRYNSMGLGSNYGSFYNVFRTDSARAEFEPSGGYNGATGLFTAPENFKVKRKVDPMPEGSKMLSSEGEATTGSRSAGDKKIDAADASKSRSAESGAAKRDTSSKTTGTADDVGKSQSNGKPSTDESNKADQSNVAGQSTKTASPSANKSRGGTVLGESSAVKTEPGAHRITKSVNNGVHTIAVVDDKSFIDGSDPKKVKTADGKTFAMDEVVTTSDFSVDGSDLLVDVTEQTNCSHNVALLALCGKASTSAAEKVITAVVSRAVELNKANERAGEKVTIWANAAGFPKAGHCRDLLKDPTELVPKEATYGSNPICGPRVTNLEDLLIGTPAEAEDVIDKAVNATTNSEMAYVLFTFKQIRASAAAAEGAAKKSSDQPEVYVSSLLVAFFREANMSYLPMIRHRSHTTFPGVLFTQAVGGACRTVVVVPVSKSENADARGAALQQGETMREIKNGTLRSGNVSRFLEFTEQMLVKAESGKPKPGVVAQQKQLFSDAKELISGGPEVKPKTIEVVLASQAPAPTSSERETVATRNATNDKTVRVALVVEKADVSSVSDTDKATVLVAQNKEAEIDELVYHKEGTAYPTSDLMARTAAALQEGLITAVLSVEGVPSVSLKERFTWVSFKRTVADALDANNHKGDSCEVHLYMSVVQQRQVLGDLLDSSAPTGSPMPLVVVSSPIVGPIVHNTKRVLIKDTAEVARTVDAALDRAGPLVSAEDAMVLAVAVCKTVRKKDNDVCLAALFTASASTPAPFSGLVTEDQRYSRSLFSYALAGPCTTTMVLVVDKSKLMDTSTVTNLDAVKKVASKSNLPNRDGSVRRFTTQATQSLERAKTKIAEAKNPNERQHHERNAKRLPLMIEDHNALVANPTDTTIPIYMADGSRPSASDTRSTARSGATGAGPSGMTDAQSVLIVLDKPGSTGAQVDASNETITSKGVSCKPTELIEMKGSTLRSSHVDSIVTLALTGYNTAMLTADTAGSTVGRSLVTRSVRMLLAKLTGKSEAYWSVVVVRNGKFKDMLAAGSSYSNLTIASSPIFGPCVDGGSFAKLDPSGVGVEEAIKNAATERAYAGGLVLITVVPKLVQEDGKDVMMPSMVLTLVNDDTKVYDQPLSVEQKHRGVFHYVFGGPCYTLFVAGINPSEEATASAILTTCNAVMEVKNPPLRSGSVMRFIEHSTPKLKDLEGKIATAQGSVKDALMSQQAMLERMINDAKNLIANPVDCVPPKYSAPRHRA